MRAKTTKIWSGDAPDARIPVAAYLLAGCLAVIGANAFALSAIAPEIARSFAIKGPDVMVAATVYGLATAVSALSLPGQIDRWGVFPCLKAAIAVFVAAVLASAAAPSVIVLAMAQGVAGRRSAWPFPPSMPEPWPSRRTARKAGPSAWRSAAGPSA